MSEQTVTAPGKHTTIKTTSKPSATDQITVSTAVMDFDSVKHLLSDKPLQFPPAAPRD